MPAIPQNLAGTILGYGERSQMVLADDDAQAWHEAGFTVCPMGCQCSERIVDGEQTLTHDTFWAAVDTHGYPADDIGAWIGAESDGADAIGVFHGATLGAAVYKLTGGAESVQRAHRALQRNLPHFECFAVLSLDDRPVMLAHDPRIGQPLPCGEGVFIELRD